MQELFLKLAAPFSADEVKAKPQTVSGGRAMAVHYIDARAVQDRLDDVLGPEGWQDSYTVLAGVRAEYGCPAWIPRIAGGNRRISWPRCRAAEGTHGGGSGLLLDDELARAVRTESAAAVMYWWGVSEGVVWRWRKVLEVTKTNNKRTPDYLANDPLALADIDELALFGRTCNRDGGHKNLATSFGFPATLIGRYSPMLMDDRTRVHEDRGLPACF